MGLGITDGERALLALAPEARTEVIRRGLQSLDEERDLGGSVGAAVRKRSTQSFPCSVVYLHDREDVIILAYPHDRQRPGCWQGRALGISGD